MATTQLALPRQVGAFLMLAGVLGVGAAGVAPAADHRDSPRITANITSLGNLDILDVYAFQSPKTRTNTVFIMTMSTDAGVISPPFFNPRGLYEFKVLNRLDHGKLSPDLTYQLTFSSPNVRTGQQTFTLTRFDANGRGTRLSQGSTNRPVPVRGGGLVQAGLFDDPFFFDLLAFNRFKARALKGDPGAADEFLKRTGGPIPNIPNNFFGGFNCIAIVLELPSAQLQSTAADRNIGLWARTVVPGAQFNTFNPEQFDRMGRPGINTVLSPDALKDDFNSATPEDDAGFREPDKRELGILFGTPDDVRTQQVNLLLPDVLTMKTRDPSGFDKLNGRRLADDVIDVELNLLSQGAVTTDNVDNDSVFRAGFPYLGTPNPKAVALKAARESLAREAAQAP